MKRVNVLVNNKEELKILIDNKVLLSDYGYFCVNCNRFPTIFTLFHSNVPGYQDHCPLNEWKKDMKRVKTVNQYLKSKHCKELIEIMKEPYVDYNGKIYVYNEIAY